MMEHTFIQIEMLQPAILQKHMPQVRFSVYFHKI